MKCPNCGTENKKSDKECKNCKQLLQEVDTNKENDITNKDNDITNKELKEELKKELKADLTMEIQDLKDDIAKEILKENKIKPKRRKGLFYRLFLSIKLLILLAFLSVVALIVYVYGFYDYQTYYKDALTRYYESENEQYIDSIKLFFRVYKYDLSKVSKAQKIGGEIINDWIVEVNDAEYVNDEARIEALNNLNKLIDDLYNSPDLSGHTPISKKEYNNISSSLKELMEPERVIEEEPKEEDNKNEEEKPTEEPEKDYELTNMRSLDIAKALKLFEREDVNILYIGKDDCPYCKDFIPVLNKISKEKNIRINYIDIEKVSDQDKGYDDLIKKLNLKPTGEKKTYGELFGATPMTIIIKNGKQVDGSLGLKTYDEYIKVVNKYF